jgi:uncharacterized membrane protein
MNLKKSGLILIGIIMLSLIFSIYFYPQMPERIVAHWNIKGEADGYMTKFWGLFIMPFILVGLILLFIILPKIDPLKENYKKFNKYYDGFVILLSLFLFLIHLQIILWNIGIKISPNITIPVGLGLLYFYIGILFENTRQNWFIGIRTPWTLSSENVWEKTHKIGSKLFKAAGVIAILGIFFSRYALFFVIVPVLLLAVYTVVYSYIAFKKEIKQ